VKGAGAISERLGRIQALTSRLNSTKGDCADNATPNAQLAANTAGLTGLASTLAAETDLTKAKSEYQSVFGNYRIYVLQLPKTEIVTNCGTNIARAAKLKARSLNSRPESTLTQRRTLTYPPQGLLSRPLQHNSRSSRPPDSLPTRQP